MGYEHTPGVAEIIAARARRALSGPGHVSREPSGGPGFDRRKLRVARALATDARLERPRGEAARSLLRSSSM